MINSPNVLIAPSLLEAKELHTDKGRINWGRAVCALAQGWAHAGRVSYPETSPFGEDLDCPSAIIVPNSQGPEAPCAATTSQGARNSGE